jgi:hypothetical protein
MTKEGTIIGERVGLDNRRSPFNTTQFNKPLATANS